MTSTLILNLFKSTIETYFRHLKEATSRNVQNIETSLNIQQTYSSTLCTHVNNRVTISVQGIFNTPQEPSVEEDDNSPAPGQITTSQNQQETNWPDAPAVQIPGISSTTLDQPPEVMYNRCQTQPPLTELKIPKLEEDSDQDQFVDPDYLITNIILNQESQRI